MANLCPALEADTNHPLLAWIGALEVVVGHKWPPWTEEGPWYYGPDARNWHKVQL